MFFSKFDAITYNQKMDKFTFKFNYKKFKKNKEDFQNIWTVYSLNEAWQNIKNKQTGNFEATQFKPTEDIKEILTKYDIALSDNFDLLEVLKNTEVNNSNASLFKTIFYAFKLSVALRHRHDKVDEIISPVMNKSGQFFRSNPERKDFPIDADANGAYHIALKGLYRLQKDININGKIGKIEIEKYLEFVQQRNK